jgi:hypothetical protein
MSLGHFALQQSRFPFPLQKRNKPVTDKQQPWITLHPVAAAVAGAGCRPYFPPMSNKIAVDLPHHLGAAEAQRRIAANIGRLESRIPGGASVSSQWTGNRLELKVGAMGQDIGARIDVAESIVHVEVDLPPMLSFFAKPIAALLQREGGVLLEDKSKGR